MPTKMMVPDWETPVEVFHASLQRRGAKAKNERLFLEALHFFANRYITWRALPARFVN